MEEVQDERSQLEGSPDDVSSPSSNEEEHATEGSSEMVPEKRAVHSDEDSGEDARTADTVTVDTESEEQLPPETTYVDEIFPPGVAVQLQSRVSKKLLAVVARSGSFTCDAKSHDPWSIFTVVRVGALVRLKANDSDDHYLTIRDGSIVASPEGTPLIVSQYTKKVDGAISLCGLHKGKAWFLSLGKYGPKNVIGTEEVQPTSLFFVVLSKSGTAQLQAQEEQRQAAAAGTLPSPVLQGSGDGTEHAIPAVDEDAEEKQTVPCVEDALIDSPVAQEPHDVVSGETSAVGRDQDLSAPCDEQKEEDAATSATEEVQSDVAAEVAEVPRWIDTETTQLREEQQGTTEERISLALFNILALVWSGALSRDEMNQQLDITVELHAHGSNGLLKLTRRYRRGLLTAQASWQGMFDSEERRLGSPRPPPLHHCFAPDRSSAFQDHHVQELDKFVETCVPLRPVDGGGDGERDSEETEGDSAEEDGELWRVLDRMWMLFHQGRPEAAFGRDERDWMVLGFTSPTDPLNDIGDLDALSILKWILWTLEADVMLYKAMRSNAAARNWGLIPLLRRVRFISLTLLRIRVLDRVLISGGSHSLSFIFKKYCKKLALDACSNSNPDIDTAIALTALPSSSGCSIC